MATPDYLTSSQYAILLDVFSAFADQVERVDVYGSRSRGTHRPGSDIDLILVGDIDLEGLLRIAVALEESSLSISADVQRYSAALQPAFAAELARDARVLFDQAQLLAHARSKGALPHVRAAPLT